MRYDFLAPEHEQLKIQGARIKRYTIDLKTGSVSTRQITHEQVDMPTINYKKNNAKNYHYLYGIADTKPYLAPAQDKLVKINVKTEEVKNWQQEFCYVNEPIFVASPHAKDEDNGVVLSIIFDAQKEKSFLLILDGETFTEKARVLLNHHIPYQFHGLFVE